MPANLRLEHAELCAGCTDILRTGTLVHIHDNGQVVCLACDDQSPCISLNDPWAALDDLELRTRLAERHLVAA